MSTNSSYGPNEPLSTVVKERTILMEEIFNGVGWGVVFVLYWQCMASLSRRRRSWFLRLYSSALFIIGTLYLAGCMILTAKMYIDERNLPGGPSAVIVAVYSQPVIMMANVSYPLQGWLSDALMIYRCYVIYSSNLLIAAFPVLILLGSFTCGTMLLIQETKPNIALWSRVSVQLAIPYFALSISLNIIVTILIVIRLLMHRRQLQKALGPEHATTYTSISAMLVESAALNTGCSLIFLVLYARTNSVSNVFQGLVVYCQITASLLIVQRVAQGRGWGRETGTVAPASSVMFKTATGNATSTTPYSRTTHTMDYTPDNDHVDLEPGRIHHEKELDSVSHSGGSNLDVNKIE